MQKSSKIAPQRVKGLPAKVVERNLAGMAPAKAASLIPSGPNPVRLQYKLAGGA